MAEVRTTSSTGGQKGVKLERFDLIPVGPLTELARHYGVGARKYASHQWRQGYEWSKSYAACMRHLTQFWAGFDYDVCSNDPEGCKREEGVEYEPDTCLNHTGSHHMAAVAWHAFLLLEFKDRYPEHDDRYVADPAPKPTLDLPLKILPDEIVMPVDRDWWRDQMWQIPQPMQVFTVNVEGITDVEPTEIARLLQEHINRS